MKKPHVIENYWYTDEGLSRQAKCYADL